jgi:fucose 4-O-acetylase-like acetyltransferase
MRTSSAGRDARAITASGLASGEIDALKGFFFLLVAIGHNTLINTNIEGLFPTLYAFHIQAFFFLPFLFPAIAPSRRLLAGRAVRYLVPHTAFFAVATLLYALMYRHGDSPLRIAGDAVFAWAVSSARVYKEACGFYLFWFLPTLLVWTALRGAWTVAGRGLRFALLGAVLAAHPFLGGLSEEAKRLVPLGLPIVIYMLPLALGVEWLWRRGYLPRRRAAAIGGLAAFAALLVVFRLRGGFTSLSYLSFYTWREPGMLLLADATAAAAFLGFDAAGDLLARTPGLALLGRHSMTAYLAHSLVYQGLLSLASARALEETASAAGVALGIALLAATLAISLGVAATIEKVDVLRRWITPRDQREWPPTASAARARGPAAVREAR